MLKIKDNVNLKELNNEIKEILDFLEGIVNEKYAMPSEQELLNEDEIKILLDYITNLQRDNEMYAQLKDEYEEEIKELQQENEEMKTNTIPTLRHNIDALVDEVDELEQKNERLKKYEKGYCFFKENCMMCSADKEIKLEFEDYKSRCEKASEIIKKEKEIMGYAKYDSCLLLIENILQNGDSNEVNK